MSVKWPRLVDKGDIVTVKLDNRYFSGEVVSLSFLLGMYFIDVIDFQTNEIVKDIDIDLVVPFDEKLIEKLILI